MFPPFILGGSTLSPHILRGVYLVPPFIFGGSFGAPPFIWGGHLVPPHFRESTCPPHILGGYLMPPIYFQEGLSAPPIFRGVHLVPPHLLGGEEGGAPCSGVHLLSPPPQGEGGVGEVPLMLVPAGTSHTCPPLHFMPPPFRAPLPLRAPPISCPPMQFCDTPPSDAGVDGKGGMEDAGGVLPLNPPIFFRGGTTGPTPRLTFFGGGGHGKISPPKKIGGGETQWAIPPPKIGEGPTTLYALPKFGGGCL